MNNEDSQEETPDAEPKIIVDSDWKEQVAREKEQAGEGQAETAPERSADEPSEQADSKPQAESPPPPASFEVLVYSLFAQAMSSLGQSIDPDIPQGSMNKPYAKHCIDTLEMLSEKTAGNLSDDESTMLSGILHTLRMAYVNVK